MGERKDKGERKKGRDRAEGGRDGKGVKQKESDRHVEVNIRFFFFLKKNSKKNFDGLTLFVGFIWAVRYLEHLMLRAPGKLEVHAYLACLILNKSQTPLQNMLGNHKEMR